MKTVLLIFFLNIAGHLPGDNDFRAIFGSDYSWAVNWLNTHDRQIENYARQFGVPARELKAIVFPELIRYNRVFDAIEVESLKYLYVSEGKQYADFSVGYFQMKPSFAEMVEEDASLLADKNFLKQSGMAAWQHGGDGEQGRRRRVYRITNTEQQLIYLIAFYRICRQKFSNVHFDSASDRVKFFATCYNAGYRRSGASISRFGAANHYYHYNYSEVSVYYFEKE